MSSRQRVRVALSHQEPDRVPIDMGGTGCSTMRAGIATCLNSYLGLGDTQVVGSGPSQKVQNLDVGLLERLQIDTRGVHTKAPHRSREMIHPDGRYVNEWGVEYVLPPGKYAYVPVGAPLAHATVTDLAGYDWPDPFDPGRTDGVGAQAKRWHEENSWAIVGNVDKSSIFELALAMRGFERFLVDMVTDPAFANALLDKLTEIQIIRYERFLQETGPYLDVIFFGDDVGIQNGPLISPKLYKAMIKPRHKLLFDAIRRKTNAKILYHSCGDVYPLIRDIVEIGVDCLNPVQVTAKEMDTAQLKREFGKYLSFWGAIDTQHVLPYGTPEDVRAEVRRRINDLGHEGGYVVAAVHVVQDDVPPENVVAMCDETFRAGRYPLGCAGASVRRQTESR